MYRVHTLPFPSIQKPFRSKTISASAPDISGAKGKLNIVVSEIDFWNMYFPDFSKSINKKGLLRYG
jgi:hypothetical protein